MNTIIIIMLIMIALAIVSYIAALIFYHIEQHDLKDIKKTDAEYNQRMIDKCIDTVKAGKCKHCCEKCSWNTRMRNGLIEFRRKP